MIIDVTCAIIRNEDNEILLVQRGPSSDHPYKWEFPGGKKENKESLEECIIREIGEELSIGIVICNLMPEVEYDYGKKQIRLFPFVCDTLDEMPLLSEHVDWKWLTPDKLTETDFAEADLIVARNYLLAYHPVQGVTVVKDDSETEEMSELELKDIVNRMMSMQEADWMAVSAIENPRILRKLFEYSGGDDRKLAFRASWTLTKVGDRFPELLQPHIEEIASLAMSSDNESVERSFLRILSLTDPGILARPTQGKLADHCFTALNSPVAAIAIKAYAMEILYRLTILYPELGNELAASINSQMAEGSGGIVSRGSAILKKIREIPLGS